MLYEAALLWVLLSGGYWGVHLLRRRAYPSAVFPWMMIGAAVASLLGLFGVGQDDLVLDAAGAIGCGSGVCLFLVGPLARRLARRANSVEQWWLARAAYEIAEVLQPGTGVREEKQLASAFARIASGQSEDAVAAVRALRASAPPPAQRVLDEHLAMVYLTAWRWQDAIDHVEAALPERGGGPLGDLSPGLWVELMSAYARVGRFERAAEMAQELERELGSNPAAGALLHRSRVLLLALCGHVEGVRALTSGAAARLMKPAARHYWLGVAASKAGERELARAELTASMRRAGGRRRRMANEELERVESCERVTLPPKVSELVEQLAQIPVPEVTRESRPLFTLVACAVCLGLAALLSFDGGTADLGALVRAGAAVRGLVAEGQWWRLGTSLLLHAGATHLVLNVVSLWVIGRLAENVFGTLRAAALFCACGLSGAVVSYALGPPGVSVGASGAIFGMLGAVLSELAVHRGQLAQARRSGLFGALTLVLVATLAIGMLVPGIDQWAHVGGVVSGVVLGRGLSLRHRIGRAAAPVAALVVSSMLGVWAWGAWSASQLSFVEAALGGPHQTITLGGLELVAPARWQASEGELVDPELSIILSVTLEPASPEPAVDEVSRRVEAWQASEPARARSRGLEPRPGRPGGTTSSVGLPPGWHTSELSLVTEDSVTGEQRFRALTFARRVPEGWILGTLYGPDRLFRDGGPSLATLVSSAQPAR